MVLVVLMFCFIFWGGVSLFVGWLFILLNGLWFGVGYDISL